MNRLTSVGAIAVAIAGFAVGFWCNQSTQSDAKQDRLVQEDNWRPVDRESGPAAMLDSSELSSGIHVEGDLRPFDATDSSTVTDVLPDQEFFPAALNEDSAKSGIVRVEELTPLGPVDASDLNANGFAGDPNAVKQAWDDTLKDLTPAQQQEIRSIRQQLGGAFDLDAVTGKGPQEDAIPSPSLFDAPTDGSLKPMLISPDHPSIQIVAARVELPGIIAEAETIYRDQLLNQKTIGFKSKELVIVSPLSSADFQVGQSRHANSKAVTSIKEETAKWVTRLDVSAGKIKKTGNPMDIAIYGKGWFQIKVGDKTAYTRAGVLKVDDQKRLCVRCSSGLLPFMPEIKIPSGSEILILADGRVVPNLSNGDLKSQLRSFTAVKRSLESGAGQVVSNDAKTHETGSEGPELEEEKDERAVGKRSTFGRISIVRFRDATALRRLSSGLYEATIESGPPQETVSRPNDFVTGPRIEQGAVESSNADPKSAKQLLEELIEIGKSLR